MKKRVLLLFVFVVAVPVAWIGASDSPVSALGSPRAEESDPDFDGNGLPDFHEVHTSRH